MRGVDTSPYFCPEIRVTPALASFHTESCVCFKSQSHYNRCVFTPVADHKSSARICAVVGRSLTAATPKSQSTHRKLHSAPFPLQRTPRSKVPSWVKSGLSARKIESAPEKRERPDPVLPSYPAEPAVALDCKDKWRNDMGLFMGRSFRVCFSPNGTVYMPQQCFGGDTSGRVGGAQQVLCLISCVS